MLQLVPISDIKPTQNTPRSDPVSIRHGYRYQLIHIPSTPNRRHDEHGAPASSPTPRSRIQVSFGPPFLFPKKRWGAALTASRTNETSSTFRHAARTRRPPKPTTGRGTRSRQGAGTDQNHLRKESARQHRTPRPRDHPRRGRSTATPAPGNPSLCRPRCDITRALQRPLVHRKTLRVDMLLQMRHQVRARVTQRILQPPREKLIHPAILLYLHRQLH